MYYYYGYDATNYGPARKSEVHQSKDMTNAYKNAYRMVRDGWASVCIVTKGYKGKEVLVRIVSIDMRIEKMIVMNTLRKSTPTHILKSDGTLGKRLR